MEVSTNLTRSLGFAALLAALLGPAPLLAQEAAQAEAAVPTIPYISGGVGSEGMSEIAAQEKDYSLKLFFAGKGGAWLSDVSVKITDARKHAVADLNAEGPVMLLKLAPGRYTLTATLDGKEVVQKVSVAAKGLRTVYIRFPEID